MSNINDWWYLIIMQQKKKLLRSKTCLSHFTLHFYCFLTLFMDTFDAFTVRLQHQLSMKENTLNSLGHFFDLCMNIFANEKSNIWIMVKFVALQNKPIIGPIMRRGGNCWLTAATYAVLTVWFSKGSFHLSALQRQRISSIATMAPLLPSLFPHWWALKVCRPLSPPRAVVHVSEVSADSALSITFALCVTAALHLD